MEEGGISNGESIEFIDWQFSSLLFGYTQRASHWTLVEAKDTDDVGRAFFYAGFPSAKVAGRFRKLLNTGHDYGRVSGFHRSRSEPAALGDRHQWQRLPALADG